MNTDTKKVLERVESWPQEDQDELAQVAAEIEARRTGIYRLSDDERAAVRQGMEAARRGDFVPDAEMELFSSTIG
jgi:predicted transcriptional regulator